jgi:radical SAM protein with 4Fe4S-binding SPASM domain
LKKIYTYLKACAGFIARSKRAYGAPASCFIETTNLCNLRCPFCVAGSGALTRPKGFLKIDEFEIILRNLPEGITDIYLWGQGEPFMTPEFLSMVRLASERGFTSIVSTNGHFLDHPKDIIDSGLDTLIVSLDGVDPDTYESYRIGGSFNKVIEGIRLLSEAASRGNSRFKIKLQCVVNNRNENDLYRYKALGRSLGVQGIEFKTLQAASLPGGESSGVGIPNDPKLSRYHKKQRGENVILEPDYNWMLRNRCLRLYYSFQVDWKGNVLPCCFDKNSEYLLGNLLDEPFDTIWNGEKYRTFRAELNSNGRKLPMCRDCTEGLRRMNIRV